MSDSQLIAEFLARKGATQCATGLAYGVDPEADKAKRAAARKAREAAERAEFDAIESEHRAERYMESVREAAHLGGAAAANDEMAQWSRGSRGWRRN